MFSYLSVKIPLRMDSGSLTKGETACTTKHPLLQLWPSVSAQIQLEETTTIQYLHIGSTQVEKNGIKEVRSSIKQLMFPKSHFHGVAALNTKLCRRTGGKLTQDHPKSLAPAIRTNSPRILIQGSTSSSQRSSLCLSLLNEKWVKQPTQREREHSCCPSCIWYVLSLQVNEQYSEGRDLRVFCCLLSGESEGNVGEGPKTGVGGAGGSEMPEPWSVNKLKSL